MNGIKLISTGSAVPKKVVTNDDLAKIADTNDEWISTRTGIRSRRYCTDGESHTSLCLAAARQALERGGVAPGEIGICLVATVTPDFLSPAAACLLQKELGFPEDTICFDLNAACSGFVYALHTAECLLASTPRKYGLVLEKELLGQEKHRVEEQAQQEALRANLLRAISHDLRTPLTAISGNAGILMENASVLDAAKRRQLYTSIYDDSMWLANLVENLLSVSRIENGTIRLKMEPELLEEVFQEALTHLDRKAKEHTITVELPDDMLMAKMDARLIVQVVINIVNNAIKYTPPGSHVQVSARKRGESVEVRIADDGPGISDEAKAKLFDMFYTANNARGDGRRGLGLGLSLCRSIVQAHGGSITVEDNYPKGAIFSFTLPLAEVNTDEQTSNLDH